MAIRPAYCRLASVSGAFKKYYLCKEEGYKRPINDTAILSELLWLPNGDKEILLLMVVSSNMHNEWLDSE